MIFYALYRLLFVAALSLQAHTSCYYPDGTYIAPDRPCIDNGTEESFCCGPGTICMSDKTCYNPKAPSAFQYVRGSCTDETFRSSACPNFCSPPSNRAVQVFQCGDATDSYCCSPDGSPCSCELGNITLDASSNGVSSIASLASKVSTTASGAPVLRSSATSNSVIGIFSSENTTSEETTASPLSSSAEPHVTVTSSVTMTSSISAPSSETLNATNSSSSSHSSSKEGAAIGVLIAVLSVTIGLLLALLIRRKCRTRPKMAMCDLLANRSGSAENSIELPATTAATEMEVETKRSELIA